LPESEQCQRQGDENKHRGAHFAVHGAYVDVREIAMDDV
jgi:hypothetical protein